MHIFRRGLLCRAATKCVAPTPTVGDGTATHQPQPKESGPESGTRRPQTASSQVPRTLPTNVSRCLCPPPTREILVMLRQRASSYSLFFLKAPSATVRAVKLCQTTSVRPFFLTPPTRERPDVELARLPTNARGRWAKTVCWVSLPRIANAEALFLATFARRLPNMP